MPKVHNKYYKDAPKDAVYIGRPSKWGNKHVIGFCGICNKEHTRTEAVIAFYRDILDLEFRLQIKQELRGKDLVCFCKPKVCHGDILLEIANAE